MFNEERTAMEKIKQIRVECQPNVIFSGLKKTVVLKLIGNHSATFPFKNVTC